MPQHLVKTHNISSNRVLQPSRYGKATKNVKWCCRKDTFAHTGNHEGVSHVAKSVVSLWALSEDV